MATVSLDNAAYECGATRQKVDDVMHKVNDVIDTVAHAAHEARALKTIAVDAVEQRVYEAAHRIRKEPFKFVGLAFAIGVPVGALLGWACRQLNARDAHHL